MKAMNIKTSPPDTQIENIKQRKKSKTPHFSTALPLHIHSSNRLVQGLKSLLSAREVLRSMPGPVKSDTDANSSPPLRRFRVV